ncbi:MAG TPA: DNRLRE domain-containing protein, partial [Humisphaera sp.]
GTAAGTRLLADLRPGTVASGPVGFVAFAGGVYFVAAADDPRFGTLVSLWRTDGTAAGTARVLAADGTAFNVRGLGNEQVLLPFQGKLAFFACPWATTAGFETKLWVTDGTTAGTRSVGAAISTTTADPEKPVVSGGGLYFVYGQSGGYASLWRHDGTNWAVVDSQALPGGMADLDGRLVYTRRADYASSPTWWAVDPTGGRTPLFFGPSGIGQVVRLGSKAYAFGTYDDAGVITPTLWETDGTQAGTRVAYRFGAAVTSAGGSVRAAAGRIWFFAASLQNGVEPWASDGTSAGTVPLGDLNPGPAYSYQREARNGVWMDPDFTAGPDGRVYFQALTPVGVELYGSDGTPAGTALVADFVPGGGDSFPGPFMTAGGALYAAVDAAGSGREWRRITEWSPTTGRLAGYVFDDLDEDGTLRDGDRPLVPGRLVYIDANGNGTPDPGEPTATTTAEGYWFDGLSPGTYTVRAVVPPGLRQTGPAGARTVTLVAGRSVAGLDFGLAPAREPTASPGGPYQVLEGGLIQLAGIATAPVGTTVVSFEWDLDYDGVTFSADATGSSTAFSAAGIDGPTGRTVALRVTDSAGRAVTATTTVMVDNVAPTATLGGAPPAALGQPSAVAFSAAADPSPADLANLRYSFDFNDDGDFADPGDVADSAAPSAAFTFPAAGTYTVRGRVADDDGGYTDYTTTVVVNPPPPPPPAPSPVNSTRDLRAAADAYAADGTKASANFGTAAELQVRKSTTAGNSRESFLRFDLTAGPAYSTLESAALRVFAKASAAGSVAMDLYAVAGTSWSETGLTWNARPAVGAKLASRTVSSTTAAWVEFDVSAYVRAQRAAGATKVAFALRSPTATTPYVTFASDEAAANRPALRLGERVSPAVVFSAAVVTVPEAKTATATVRLTVAPLGPVTVTVARTGGDGDLSAAPAALTFTPANWATPQPVAFAAAADADAANGSATFAASADGYTGKSLTATEADDDVPKVLRASADGYVRDGTYAGTNYGQAAALQVRKSTTAGNTRWAVLKFDLAAVTTVSSAVLRLYGRLDATANPSVAVQAFAASAAAWTEGGVTWSNKPTPSGAALGQATVAGTTARWYAIDLTAWLAAQKAAGKTSAALVLTAPVATTSAVLFNSDEATASRPELVVTA